MTTRTKASGLAPVPTAKDATAESGQAELTPGEVADLSPGEWILFSITEEDAHHCESRGRVIAHSPTRGSIARAERRMARAFAGFAQVMSYGSRLASFGDQEARVAGDAGSLSVQTYQHAVNRWILLRLDLQGEAGGVASAAGTGLFQFLPAAVVRPPQAPARPKATPSGRKRGDQPGHPCAFRSLFPVEQVDQVVVVAPGACRRCQQPFPSTEVRHSRPWRRQVVELLPLAALWMFARVEGVEPTHNVSERTLRPAVLWRKGSSGRTVRRGAGLRSSSSRTSTSARMVFSPGGTADESSRKV